MKSVKVISRVLLISVLLIQQLNLNAQKSNFNCECALCEGVPCNAPASAHTNPACPVYQRNKAASLGPTAVSGDNSLESMIISSMLDAILFSSKTNDAKSAQERQEAEKIQKQLAIRQAKLKKYNDSIAQVGHDKMLKNQKKLEGTGDIAYKSINDDSKWVVSVKFNCKISSYKGDVRVVKSDGSISKLSATQTVDIGPGDWIYTGINSRLNLHYEFENGGKDMIIGQNSYINIVPTEDGTQVPKLVSGKIHFSNRIADNQKEIKMKEPGYSEPLISFMRKKCQRWQVVRTPSACCCIRGTTFSVSQDSIVGTTLIVSEGSVGLQGLLIGQMILIEAGYKGTITPSGQILGPIKIEDSEMEKWWESE